MLRDPYSVTYTLSYRTLLLVVVATACVALAGTAQSITRGAPPVSVAPIFAALSVEPKDVLEAETLNDLNPHYHPEWVRTYHRVAITTLHDGEACVSVGESDSLTAQQRARLADADADARVQVDIDYLPANSLADNPARRESFGFRLRPARLAAYPGGDAALSAYLQAAIVAHVHAGDLAAEELIAVTFVVDAAGAVTGAEVFAPYGRSAGEAARRAAAEGAVLAAVEAMPDWAPARLRDGTAASQAYSVLVGNQESCDVNLLGLSLGK